ncbi:MAG: serine/threonine-protein kinase [Polyangiales bacterium]
MPSAVVGQVIAGKYRVERVLGKGAMGTVVEAKHQRLGERVAIKIIVPELAANADIVERFFREARACAKIHSDHVPLIHDLGQLEDGSPYMAMDFLDGQDLAERLHEKGPLRLTEAVDCVLQACQALAVAHSIGIVHRDIKPANLFLVRNSHGSNSIKVLDFGISKLTQQDLEQSLTDTGAFMGSPQYVSPEQLNSAKDADARTDVYSLGAVLFELLTGRPPFPATDMPALVRQILRDPPPAPSSVNRDVPAGLDDIVRACLAKNREERVASVAELATMLAPFASASARPMIESIRRTVASVKPAASPTPSTKPPPPAPRKEPPVVLLLAIIAVLLVVVVALLSRRH